MEKSSAVEDDNKDSKSLVTRAAARCLVQLVRHYFVEQGFSDVAHASFNACAALIYSRAHVSYNLKQATLRT